MAKTTWNHYYSAYSQQILSSQIVCIPFVFISKSLPGSVLFHLLTFHKAYIVIWFSSCWDRFRHADVWSVLSFGLFLPTYPRFVGVSLKYEIIGISSNLLDFDKFCYFLSWLLIEMNYIMFWNDCCLCSFRGWFVASLRLVRRNFCCFLCLNLNCRLIKSEICRNINLILCLCRDLICLCYLDFKFFLIFLYFQPYLVFNQYWFNFLYYPSDFIKNLL